MKSKMNERQTLALEKINKLGEDILPEDIIHYEGMNYLLCRLKTATGWRKYQIPLTDTLHRVFVRWWDDVERTEITLSRRTYGEGYELTVPVGRNKYKKRWYNDAEEAESKEEKEE